MCERETTSSGEEEEGREDEEGREEEGAVVLSWAYAWAKASELLLRAVLLRGLSRMVWGEEGSDRETLDFGTWTLKLETWSVVCRCCIVDVERGEGGGKRTSSC